MICHGGQECDGGLRHALAFAGELRRRVLLNKENIKKVAAQMGLDYQQVRGVLRLVRKVWPLSAERLALVVMKDPGLDNADVAEIFGRPTHWAQSVRRSSEAIKQAEPIDPDLEWIDDGLQPDTPMPDEIHRRAMEVRQLFPLGGRDATNRPYGIRQYRLEIRNGTFVRALFN